jgi:histidinol-phosphate phosphatase family protein
MSLGNHSRAGGDRSAHDRAVFLDKDGTLIENVPYNVDPGRIRLLDGAGEALAQLHCAGFRLIVISNQSGVARGYFPEDALAAVEDKLRDLLRMFDVPLAAFYYCPHHPEGTNAAYRTACDCRKPAPGLIRRAAREHAIDCSRSWLVGDLLEDVEAGRRGGCRTIWLADPTHKPNHHESKHRRPHYRVRGLVEAARIILATASE